MEKLSFVLMIAAVVVTFLFAFIIGKKVKKQIKIKQQQR
jgi:uncharacterized membrane protein